MITTTARTMGPNNHLCDLGLMSAILSSHMSKNIGVIVSIPVSCQGLSSGAALHATSNKVFIGFRNFFMFQSEELQSTVSIFWTSAITTPSSTNFLFDLH
jgi:hypothetical protein